MNTWGGCGAHLICRLPQGYNDLRSNGLKFLSTESNWPQSYASNVCIPGLMRLFFLVCGYGVSEGYCHSLIYESFAGCRLDALSPDTSLLGRISYSKRWFIDDGASDWEGCTAALCKSMS